MKTLEAWFFAPLERKLTNGIPHRTISYVDLVQSWDDYKTHLEHIRQAHLGKERFPCPVCDAYYKGRV